MTFLELRQALRQPSYYRTHNVDIRFNEREIVLSYLLEEKMLAVMYIFADMPPVFDFCWWVSGMWQPGSTDNIDILLMFGKLIHNYNQQQSEVL